MLEPNLKPHQYLPQDTKTATDKHLLIAADCADDVRAEEGAAVTTLYSPEVKPNADDDVKHATEDNSTLQHSYANNIEHDVTESANEEVFENALPEPEVDDVAPTIEEGGKELGNEVSEPEVVGDNSGNDTNNGYSNTALDRD